MTAYSPVIAHACRLLEVHGGRLTFREISRATGAAVDELRRQAEAYADLDSVATLDRYVGTPAYFLVDPADPLDPDAPPCDDDFLVLTASPQDLLGIEQFDATVLGPLYSAAVQLLMEEPENADLRAASDLLRERFLPGMRPVGQFGGRHVAALHRAITEHRKVRIVYSRAWRPGISERVVEPYQLVHTSRGPEVDAGPLDESGAIRTFLVARIRELELLDDTFEAPADALERCARARQLTVVTGYVPHSALWSVEKWAERLEATAQDRDGLAFRAHLLPPVEGRAALILLMAGDDAYLDDPALDRAAADLAQRLLAHHGLAG